MFEQVGETFLEEVGIETNNKDDQEEKPKKNSKNKFKKVCDSAFLFKSWELWSDTDDVGGMFHFTNTIQSSWLVQDLLRLLFSVGAGVSLDHLVHDVFPCKTFRTTCLSGHMLRRRVIFWRLMIMMCEKSGILAPQPFGTMELAGGDKTIHS